MIFIYIYIYHHHGMPLAHISLTLPYHSSLSPITLARSSMLHPVSIQGIYIYICVCVCVCNSAKIIYREFFIKAIALTLRIKQFPVLLVTEWFFFLKSFLTMQILDITDNYEMLCWILDSFLNRSISIIMEHRWIENLKGSWKYSFIGLIYDFCWILLFNILAKI